MNYLTPKRRILLERVLKEGVVSTPGPCGPMGPQGREGPRGEQGIQGVKGEQGLKGDTGAQGIQGERGLQGIQGIKGDTGQQGIQGIKGDKGDQGIQGIPGYTPVKGIDYFDGAKGEKGEQGIQGIQGIQGEQGIQGIPGNGVDVSSSDIINALGFTPANTIHNLVDTTKHPVSGLTTGHFLRANSTTTYGFSALPTSTTSAQGMVELATLAEVTTGTDTARAVTPQGVKQETNKCAKLTVASLPTASVTYRGQFYLVQGTTGTADKAYICTKNADDTYSWKPITGFSW